MRRRFVFFTLTLCLSLNVIAVAHGPLHEQIEEVTGRIEREPGNANLYLSRGELHRIHRDWASAQSDYQKVRSLDPGLDRVDFCQGRMLLEAGRLTEARTFLDRFLSAHPDDPEALLTRARVKTGLGQRVSAAEDYTRAINGFARPKPEHYLERSRAQAADGLVEEALRGLDEGIQRLGPLVTLELQAIDLELKVKRYDAALSRLDRVMIQSPRKEVWLTRRGEILAQGGREREAQEAFALALKDIESLPAQHRGTKATKELEKQLRALLHASD